MPTSGQRIRVGFDTEHIRTSDEVRIPRVMVTLESLSGFVPGTLLALTGLYTILTASSKGVALVAVGALVFTGVLLGIGEQGSRRSRALHAAHALTLLPAGHAQFGELCAVVHAAFTGESSDGLELQLAATAVEDAAARADAAGVRSAQRRLRKELDAYQQALVQR